MIVVFLALGKVVVVLALGPVRRRRWRRWRQVMPRCDCHQIVIYTRFTVTTPALFAVHGPRDWFWRRQH
jgi:hypothetical protein